MKNDTIAATAGRLAGHVWLALQLIDWREVARIVLHGLLALAVLLYLAGHALGSAVHRSNDWLSTRWVALLVEQPLAAPEPCKPCTPAPPVVAPLYDDLAHLPVRQLMALAGTRSKKYRRADLLAMVAAC
jgi:hypothetical protein